MKGSKLTFLGHKLRKDGKRLVKAASSAILAGVLAEHTNRYTRGTHYSSAVTLLIPCYHIKNSGFTCPVGADKSDSVPCLYLKAARRKKQLPTEAFGYIGGL